VAGVPSIIIARTDSLGANLLTSDVDERDREFTTGERSPEGFYYVQPGIDMAVARGLAYAPYADLLWCETATPDLEEARIFAERIRAEYPDKLLAYNCSPSFNWREHLDDDTIASFQRELGAMGYALQFVTLVGDSATSRLREVAAGYFDDIATTISGGATSTLAPAGSTEAQ
jgi:isocitrate lyase